MITEWFKDKKVFINSHKVMWHPLLMEVAWWIYEERGEIIITSAYREKPIYSKDSGIHSTHPLRAMDIRSWIYSDPKRLEHRINSHWIYDPSRPQKRVAKYHYGATGNHIHLQVHNHKTFLK